METKLKLLDAYYFVQNTYNKAHYNTIITCHRGKKKKIKKIKYPVPSILK